MFRYVLKRIELAVVTVLLVIVILFFLMHLMPGSPFNGDRLTAEQQALLEESYGLDKPILVQAGIYVKNMLTGDFGVSYAIQQNYPVAKFLAVRFPVTIRISLQAFVLGLVLGILLGIAAALKHNSAVDTGASLLSMIGSAIPSYVFALGLVYFLAYKAGWFPLTYDAKAPFLSSVLPTVALSIMPMSMAARHTRNEMIEVMNSEYMALAELKGISRFSVIVVHGLKNALIPLITAMGPMILTLITGSTVVEQIFSIPGIGSLFINAINAKDFNVVISLAFIFSVLYIGIMLVIDLLYGVIDPRIRVAGGEKR